MHIDFQPFKLAVAAQFERLMGAQPFRVSLGKDEETDSDVTKDRLWAAYLGSFPEGTNPMYRVKTEHDCSCCRRFVRAVGNVVAVVDGKLLSVWDINTKGVDPAFQTVAHQLASLVKASPISDDFLHRENTAGSAATPELLDVDGRKKTVVWNHFHVSIPSQFVRSGADIPTALSKVRSAKDVFVRALNEFSVESLDQVLDLIAQNSLYRGAEFKQRLTRFRELKVQYEGLKAEKQREVFAWVCAKREHEAVTHMRNHAIGTLMIDVNDPDLELKDAVHKFAVSTMAPANYQRPTSLISKKDIERASAKIKELGLEGALERRYAVDTDISIQNVLFANSSARKNLKGSALDDLMATVPSTKSMEGVEEIRIGDFLNNVVPRVNEIEVWLDNQHKSRLVSLVAPVNPGSGRLFKWDNPFSWDYAGNVTDAIKERVKAAGGAVEGDLCCRLAWDYTDDLDFHMIEPNGYHIYYGTKRTLSSNGGILDLDANGGDGLRAEPAENIVYADRRRMKDGIYKLAVKNFNRRSDGRGFTVQIEFDGETHEISYEPALADGKTIEVAQIQYKGGRFSIVDSLPSSRSVQDLWGLKTQQFVPVSMVMLSPNFWDDQEIGNKHWFFMLQGARRTDPARGFYNEYLSAPMIEHRKVFEVLGSKTKVKDSDNQLAGLGFSSTQHDTLLCRVKGSFNRTLKIVF